ncbi:B-cell receptor CD22-like [Archocentrus centrarchus]|uniref:B-cell receptor CD22-like n=1 Tax=Archocentrus centrarchus TaxID=63155 RepID=UPI0011EA1215|nr:B-cell receptor CD22-like [Archocentrus centrarchus]
MGPHPHLARQPNKHAPKLPSVSVSPSEIVEGSSVTLTCSSDANPEAKYTWYKEDEESPKASGEIFTITDFRPEHNGSYYCVAQNTRGSQNSTSHDLTVAQGSWKLTFLSRSLLQLWSPSSSFSCCGLECQGNHNQRLQRGQTAAHRWMKFNMLAYK